MLFSVKKKAFCKGLSEKGSSVVEFALSLPFLLLIIFGIMEYGWYLTNQIVLSNAVSAGARAGVKAREWEGEDPALFARTVTRNAFWVSSIPVVDVDILEQSLSLPRRIRVTVASLEYSPITGFLPIDFLPEFVKARSVMVFP